MKPIRLCHLNLARGFRGGERQTELIIRELAKLGVQQQVIVRAGQPLAQRLSSIPGLHIDEIGKPYLRHAAKMRGALLHAHTGNAAHVAHWMRWIAGCPYVLTRRVDNPPGNNFLTRDLYRRAAGIAAISEAIRSILIEYQPSLDIAIIPSAHGALTAQPDVVRKLRADWGGDFVVGQVGALVDRHKGQAVLIDAARQLAGKRPNWRFVLVGGGSDEAEMRARAADAPNVVFTGEVENVGDYLAAFDVFAMPSRFEGLGSTSLDAMSLGLPVVASNVGGIPEAVRDEREGLLFTPGDSDALARSLLKVGDNAELRAEFARAALKRAEAFAPATLGQRYLQWYRALGFEIA